MKYVAITFALILITHSNALAMAKEGCGGECASCHTLTQKEAGTLLKEIGEVKQVKPAAVRGLWEVTIAQGEKQAIAYVDYSKKYIINGGIFDIASKKAVGATAPVAPRPGKVKVSAIPLRNSVVVGNPQAKKKLFLFTDPECPFCAKQHAELPKLLADHPELAVYIKLNPLKIHPNAYDKSRVILESGSSKLLDDAFSGKPLPVPGPQTSRAAVDETIKVAEKLGLKSTPTWVLPDGRVLIGYQEAGALAKALAEKKGKTK